MIEKGTAVILPVYGLHTDGKYYEKPAVFKPERFLPGSRENLTKYTFLPFGEGPRACLGTTSVLWKQKVTMYVSGFRTEVWDATG